MFRKIYILVVLSLIFTNITLEARVSNGNCLNRSSDYYINILRGLHKLYPEVKISELERLQPDVFYSRDLGISFLAPKAWKEINRDNILLYLTKGKSVEINIFTFLKLKKFWKDSNIENPNQLLKVATKYIIKTSLEDAKEHNDTLYIASHIKIIKIKRYRVAHIVLKRLGEINRWESWTLIYNGKDIYVLYITSDINSLIRGEFLSYMAVKSFCSE